MSSDEAKNRIDKWIKKNDKSAKLDLSGLGLTVLPPLPDGIKCIDVSQNKLKFLPESINDCVEIYCWDNEIESLQSFKKCKTMWCFKNKIKSVHELPECELFDGRDNVIKCLPPLPKALVIYAEGNPLQKTVFAPNCVIFEKDAQPQLILA